VTAKRKRVTNRKQGATDDIFSTLGNPRKLLLRPYRTHDLCPDNLCFSTQMVLTAFGMDFVRALLTIAEHPALPAEERGASPGSGLSP
jgi:hypothetical protein